jgi:hypothetical protein
MGRYVLDYSLAFTTIVGSALTIGLIVWSSPMLRELRVRDVAGTSVPVFPGAFVTFAVAILLPLCWVRNRERVE